MNKEIFILSDTHSYLDDSLLPYMNNSDEVWHCGDIGNLDVLERLESSNTSFKGVYGNIDGHEIRAALPEFQLIQYGSHSILIIHIAGSIRKYTPRCRDLIQSYSPTILVCGHSHILKVAADDRYQLLYINPGACGHHGFHKFRTAIQLVLTEDSISKMDVVQLGQRGRNIP
jgi:putative phosphoesterase